MHELVIEIDNGLLIGLPVGVDLGTMIVEHLELGFGQYLVEYVQGAVQIFIEQGTLVVEIHKDEAPLDLGLDLAQSHVLLAYAGTVIPLGAWHRYA